MKAKVTISRNSRDIVRILIKDTLSKVKVCEVSLSLEDYAQIITGLSEVEGDVEYGNLLAVGKQKVVESRQAFCPAKERYSLPAEEAKAYLLEHCQEEGWTIDTYLGSKNSVTATCTSNGLSGYTINYKVYKYVEASDDNPKV